MSLIAPARLVRPYRPFIQRTAESIQAIENAENSTLIWLAVLLGMVIGWQVLKLGGQAMTGFFGNNKAQHSLIGGLLKENTETRQALVNTNNELL